MRKIQFTVLLAVILGCLLSNSISAREAASTPAELVDHFLEESEVPGFAVTVALHGKTVWSEGFGHADLEQKVAVEPARTRFRVGSTAKSMTAMALAQLYEAGKLNLDSPIQRYLPEFPFKSAPITSRQLAGHLAGIRHYEGEEFLSTTAYPSVVDALVIFSNDPLVSEPGAAFNYSTYGYNLLSAVMEKAAGQDFLEYMATHVFEPIGMTQTVPDRVLAIIPGRSRYYALEDNELVNAPWVDNSNKWAGGGFLSTSEDLVRFGQAHLTDRFLKQETIQMLWTSQTTSSGEETGYGIGWGVRSDDAGRRVIAHTGGSVGGRTDLRIYPDHGLVIATIANIYPAETGPITSEIVEFYLGPSIGQ